MTVLLLSGQLFAGDVRDEDAPFKYTLSSGAVSIHKKAHSVDWALVNTSRKPQHYRVTVYEVRSGDKDVIAPGSLTGALEPSGSTHNANSVGEGMPFVRGRKYEVVVEVNSRKVLPKVEMWSSGFEVDVIPETVIQSNRFRRLD